MRVFEVGFGATILLGGDPHIHGWAGFPRACSRPPFRDDTGASGLAGAQVACGHLAVTDDDDDS